MFYYCILLFNSQRGCHFKLKYSIKLNGLLDKQNLNYNIRIDNRSSFFTSVP